MKPLDAIFLVTHLGPRWGWFRLRYVMRRKSGALQRRTPRTTWGQVPVFPVTPFGRFQVPETFGADAVTQAEAILRGQFRLFSHHDVSAGFPPRWNVSPLSGGAVPAGLHWTEIGDFAHGDIKAVWELSRFPWAFVLARAYGQTGDERYAAAFWRLFEDWMECNPPNCGPNWMCGQEATFRLMAATFATEVLARASSSTAERRTRFARFVVATGRRVAANVDYALSQANNHGISECVGLITAALLVADAPEAARWRQLGMAGLERQLEALVYPDGGFAQHSAVYHRVLLHDLYWVISVLRARGETVPSWLTGAADRALDLLEVLVDPASGRPPLFGANDGANVLPLADADFLDFRPTLEAGRVLLGRKPSSTGGPWNEMAGWLLGRADEAILHSSDSTPGAGPTHFADAGCVVWLSGDSRLFLRCPTRFRHRPSQSDLLHVDVSYKGCSIAHDAGTFSYNTAGPLAGAMKDAAVHNAVTFDHAEPMRKVGRFLYLPWPKGTYTQAGNRCVATHDGWNRLGVRHLRSVTSPASSIFIVQDELTGSGRHRARLHWLLADGPHAFEPDRRRIVLRTAAGGFEVSWDTGSVVATVSLVRADPASSRGWWSPYYLAAEPALSLAIDVDFDASVTLTTRFSPLSEP